MIQTLLFFIIIFYSSILSALLPPYYESAKEINAILADPQVTEIITSGRVIHSVVKTETGYTIVAGECTLLVNIHYLSSPDGLVGPANFEIEPGEIICKKE